MAQRVIHHYINRPALSLGVVTFSEAQAGAIEAALDEARKQNPAWTGSSAPTGCADSSSRTWRTRKATNGTC